MKLQFPLNNIARLRKERGLTLQQLAESMDENMTVPTIHKLERSTMELRHSHILRLSEIFDCPASEILNEGIPALRMVPVLGDISAGNWSEQVEKSNESVPVIGSVGGKNMFALRPDGDSMSKLIGDSDYIVVDPDQCDLVSGRAYAIANMAGDATFKRFMEGPARLEPFSHNDTHQPIPLGREAIRVIGRVVFAVRAL